MCDMNHRNRQLTPCNTLQHTATQCNTLQHTATHCNTLQHNATQCNVGPSISMCFPRRTASTNFAWMSAPLTSILSTRFVAVCCSVLQCVAMCCNVMQCAAMFFSILQCLTVCCSVLQNITEVARKQDGAAVDKRLPVCCSVL